MSDELRNSGSGSNPFKIGDMSDTKTTFVPTTQPTLRAALHASAVEANKFTCISRYGCRAPLACGGFGYCRDRNFDGMGMDRSQVERRRAESVAAMKIGRF